MTEAGITRRRLLAWGAMTVLAAGCADATDRRAPLPSSSPGRTGPPIIYSTDLSHPHLDPDDHFDLAIAHGLDLDVRAVLLDQHASLSATPGFAPVAQLNELTGRAWPARDGLRTPLRSPQDWGDSGDDTDAATAVLDLLRSSDGRVAVVNVGSCRDVAAAYNRDPLLFHERIERLVIFAGEATLPGFVEYNVSLDPHAFVRLMGSGLPVRWVPCFDGGLWQAGPHASFVQVPQADLLPPDLPTSLLRYFLYMVRREASDPIAYLSQPLTRQDRQLLSGGRRNLWAGSLLALGDGDGSVRFEGATVAVFEPVTVRLSDTGALDPAGAITARADRLRVLDRVAWERAMVAGVVSAFRQIPVLPRYR